MSKHHGMLFKGVMVNKVKDKVAPKTQTRRPITFSNSICTPRVRRDEWHELRWGSAEVMDELSDNDNTVIPVWFVPFRNTLVLVYPRIQPRDVIWVKETWRFRGTDMNCLGRSHSEQDGVFVYKADGKQVTIRRPWQDIEKYMVGHSKWRSSMLMPRWASRIDLLVLAMRSERVQEISAMDAVAEGIESEHAYDGEPGFGYDMGMWYKDYSSPAASAKVQSPIISFMTLWDSINTDRGFPWDGNHPVWIHDFKEVEG